MQKYSVAFLLLCCFIRSYAQSVQNTQIFLDEQRDQQAQRDRFIAKNEGIGILLVDWKLVADTPVKNQITDSRLFNIGNYYAYTCLEKNANGYLVKCMQRSYKSFDSTLFYINPKHKNAVQLLKWDHYWDTVISSLYNPRKNHPEKSDRFTLNMHIEDTLKYKMLSAPNERSTPVRCQYFSRDCIVVTAVKGDWLKVSVSMYDDCSEWLVGQEMDAHPFKYKFLKRSYKKIIKDLCFDEGWVRWKNEKECFLMPILYDL